jgi:hypothetical protein
VETLWHYMQGAQVSSAAIYISTKNRAIYVAELWAIDTEKCPVWLLTGDCDYSCPPEATRETAAAINGRK